MEPVEVVKAQLAGAVLASVMFFRPEAIIEVFRLSRELGERGVSSEEVDAVFDVVASLQAEGKRILRGQ
jgi:hypothetical protein